MKKIIISLVTLATLATPVNVSAKMYTSKELGYGNDFVVGGRNYDRPLTLIYDHHRGDTYYYRKTYVKNDKYTDYTIFGKKVYSIKLKKTTKYYTWGSNTAHGRHFYRTSKYQLLKLARKDNRYSDINDHYLYFRFKQKKGYVTSIVFGRRMWD